MKRPAPQALQAPPARSDPYWSRRGREWALAERVDPVLYGGHEAPGPLSSEQLQQFERDGYLALPAWLSPEEMVELLDACHGMKEGHEGPHVVLEPGSRVVRSVFRVQELDQRLEALWRRERIAGVARQILGSDVYVHQSRVNFKPPLDGREFYWHSDFETWHVEDGMPRMRAVSASISLTPSTEFNGPLMLVPGSHRTYVRTVGETPPEHFKASLRRQEIGVPDARCLEELVAWGGLDAPKGPAGTVVFFDCNTLHGSHGNLSPHPRTNLFYVLNSVHNRLVAPFGGQPPRPSYIAARP